MRHAGKIAPVAAVASALSTLACCLPLGFAAAASAAGAGVLVATLRPWLMGLSLVLLGVGFWQLYHTRGTCRRSRGGLAVFWVSAVIVVSMFLFPQVVASFLADRLP